MASFRESIANIFSSPHKASSVGIDIGASSIKVVEVEKVDERAVLKNYGEISLGPRAGVSVGQATSLPPESLAESLNDLLQEAGISPRHASFAIPFSASLLSVAELPEVGNKELESMIPLEARRYIPVPLSEVNLDWWVLPKRKRTERAEPSTTGTLPAVAKIEVIIAAINNEVIKKYEAIRDALHIASSATHFEIEIFSTLRAIVGSDLSPTMVIDIGAGTTKLALVDEGVVRGSHIVSMGGQDITLALARSLTIPISQAEEIKRRVGILGDEEGRDVAVVADVVLTAIANEAARFIENYERKYRSKVSKILLVGGAARLKGIEKMIAKNFPEASVALGDPFARLDAPAYLANTLKSLSPNFAVAVGAALRGLEE
ncbi:MAG: type IV pilus assembly protein PilM [Minisyncoccota bacterium]